ncbi:quinone-dependent dihydroorotate dehydrogenase [Alicyclobacillus fastidiosus]|uniref:Dihydroorotate dehydrogenase (quinone) n=1 Tax=Alicyclobacillus fastidiosus TaxID=392011 RepID=A0ABV5ADS7_9BACL|nr:quinone-dependent dihydroorotate dehydrogenase [Alicyclobacillus fastidiosus]WEH08626.1 quinone-dependent dihydroorotate dehydrogenase [Alicyclobacillus fastidiosus]
MYRTLRSVLFQFDPERAHHIVLDNLGRWPQLAKLAVRPWKTDEILQTTVLGMTVPHPVGLAAGLDKDAIAVPGLFHCGFSIVEVGTVTPVPQPGNEQPRLFRLKADEALVNRMGFNNLGSRACAQRIARMDSPGGYIGVNIGKNKITPNEQAIDDYEKALCDVLDVADYVTVNLSSPNTPGLRDLQSARTIVALLDRLAPHLERAHKPVFVKLSPDLSDAALTHITEALIESRLVGNLGIIATNTTLSRSGLKSVEKRESGGLSGRPLRARSTEVIRLVRRVALGRLPIIGCGGIFNGDDAYEKIRAGADLLQIYTAFIYEGPLVVRNIATRLAERLQQDGFSSLAEAVGIDADA